MDTVFITGATGAVGRHLSLRLLEEGYAVTGLARSRPEWWPRKSCFIEHDFASDALGGLAEVLQQSSIVIHACDVAKIDIELNKQISDQLYDLCCHGICQQFVYISSIRVYAALFGPVNESVTPKSSVRDLYGQSKLVIEDLLQERRRAGAGPKLIILRLGNVFDESTPHKFPRPEALLTRILYKGMNHHLIGGANVSYAVSAILNLNTEKFIEIFNLTQELDGENDYFYLAGCLSGGKTTIIHRPTRFGLFVRYLLARYRGEEAAGYFNVVQETTLRQYSILYPESLVEQMLRASQPHE